MKVKYLATLTLLFPLLLSCSNNISSSSSVSKYITDETTGVVLEKDFADDYVIDEDVSNENGSMSYEVFVRSFYDSNGDGIGDLNGVTYKLPYFKSLGIKTLWLMPIMPSPTYHGYDVSDYYSIHKDYGTIDDYKNLVKEAEKYNIDIMIDMVLNHCSNQNPYFRESYEDYIYGNTNEDSKADWFVWETGGGNYNGLQYEANFDVSMPDFNLDSQGVRKEIDNIFKFWIEECGTKGFRLDAVLYYYRNNTNKNVWFMNYLVETAKKYDENFYMVGECWQSDAALNSYAGSKLDSFFRFSQASGGDLSFINLIKGYGKEKKYGETIENNEKLCKIKNMNYYSSYFLSNHDQDRISKNFTVEITNKAAISLLALMPGTPYIYYGEEIGLKGKRITSPDDYSDVRRRLPMIWSKKDKTGECKFPESNRQDLNKNNEQVEDGVEDKMNEKFSLLKHYQKAINVRNKYSFLKHSKYDCMVAELETDEKSVLAYKLYLDDEYIIVVHNFSSYAVTVTSPGESIVDEINTSHLKPKLEDNKLSLGAYSTVIMK